MDRLHAGGQSLGFPTGLVVGGLLTAAYGYDVAFGVAGVAGLLAAAVAFLVLPDVSPDVETSPLRELPDVVRADPRIATIGVVTLVVRFLFAGVLLSTVALYAGEYDVTIGLLSSTGASAVVMAISVLAAGDISPADDVGTLGGAYNVFGDVGSTLGPLVALPLVARVGFVAEYLGCAVLAASAGVLVSRTLLGDAAGTDAVPADG